MFLTTTTLPTVYWAVNIIFYIYMLKKTEGVLIISKTKAREYGIV